MTASETRGAAYRANAQQALDLATSTILPQVRERQERAAARWLDLAASEDARVAHERERLVGVGSAIAASPQPEACEDRPIEPVR